MKYEITTTEEALIEYYYIVEADSPEEAKEKIPWGDFEDRKFIGFKVIDVEVKEVNEAVVNGQ